jgi:hypothetical protein
MPKPRRNAAVEELLPLAPSLHITTARRTNLALAASDEQSPRKRDGSGVKQATLKGFDSLPFDLVIFDELAKN